MAFLASRSSQILVAKRLAGAAAPMGAAARARFLTSVARPSASSSSSQLFAARATGTSVSTPRIASVAAFHATSKQSILPPLPRTFLSTKPELARACAWSAARLVELGVTHDPICLLLLIARRVWMWAGLASWGCCFLLLIYILVSMTNLLFFFT